MQRFETVGQLTAFLREGGVPDEALRFDGVLFELYITTPNARLYCDREETCSLYVKMGGPESEVHFYETL